jgi:hypothetical protein
MDTVRSQIEKLIFNVDHLMDIEREKLRRLIEERVARLADLKYQRKQLAQMLADLPTDSEKPEEESTLLQPTLVQPSAPQATVPKPTVPQPEVSRNDAARPPTSNFILETLQKEGSRGLAGPELQALTVGAGYTKDAFDKARTRLRDSRRIEMVDGMWFVVPAGKQEIFKAA